MASIHITHEATIPATSIISYGYTQVDSIDPEDYYDITIWDHFLKLYANSHEDPKQAMIDLGKRIYPTIKRTTGFPENLVTPLDFVKFEADGYMATHRGENVIPREIKDEQENEITMYAPAPGYDERLYIGVWLGILEMIGINNGNVEELGDSTYRISW